MKKQRIERVTLGTVLQSIGYLLPVAAIMTFWYFAMDAGERTLALESLRTPFVFGSRAPIPIYSVLIFVLLIGLYVAVMPVLVHQADVALRRRNNRRFARRLRSEGTLTGSELARILAIEAEEFGDREVVFICNCTNGQDLPISPSIGWYGNPDGEAKMFLQCTECQYDAIQDKIRGKYEPEY